MGYTEVDKNGNAYVEIAEDDNDYVSLSKKDGKYIYVIRGPVIEALRAYEREEEV